MYKYIIQQHIFAVLIFIVVVTLGVSSYMGMPREKNPSFEFRVVSIVTSMPGASAFDVEKLITEPLEGAIARVNDVKAVISKSFERTSTIIIKFGNLSEDEYQRRLSDLRNEIQVAQNVDLPKDITPPVINPVNSSNLFPTASVVVTAIADDENLRKQAKLINDDMKRMLGVDSVTAVGLNDPELQIRFVPDKLIGLGIAPADLADTVRAHFRDVSAGAVRIGQEDWAVRLLGAKNDPDYLSNLPVLTVEGDVPLGSVADIVRSREKSTRLVRYQGNPAILLTISKKAKANTLDMLDQVRAYVSRRNELEEATGVKLVMLYDQSGTIKKSIEIMESNAWAGLLLVFCAMSLFLGWRLGLLLCLGIPFALSGTFFVLSLFGFTLNNSVLLAVVVVMGMLVDDAVVVVESIYEKLVAGVDTLEAILTSVRQMFGPVLSAVMTVMAAFLPLIFLTGVTGDYLRVVPIVISVALFIGMFEDFVLMPAHVYAWGIQYKNKSRVQKTREKFARKLVRGYARTLAWAFRRQMLVVAIMVGLIVGSVSIVGFGMVPVKFFANDPYDVFSVDIDLQAGTTLEATLEKLNEVETVIRANIKPHEIMQIATAAGKNSHGSGDNAGQVLVTVNPVSDDVRPVDEIRKAVSAKIAEIKDISQFDASSFSDTPPQKALSIQILGNDTDELEVAAEAIRGVMREIPGVNSVTGKDVGGRMELDLQLDVDASKRAGLFPERVARNVQLLVNGEAVAQVNDNGESVSIRVLSVPKVYTNVDDFLRFNIPLPLGGMIPLGQLMKVDTVKGASVLEHYNFRRSITVSADLDQAKTNTFVANQIISNAWENMRKDYPSTTIDQVGEVTDVSDSLHQMGKLFGIGMLCIFIILATLFNSYWQPMLIMVSVPMSFIGVIFGLWIVNDSFSLFTLYAIIALSGVAVNAAIVLIERANEIRFRGANPVFSAIMAARRRFQAVVISTITEVVGFVSLATGAIGSSVMWSPVATTMMWGLSVSAILTLYLIPILYSRFAPSSKLSVDSHNLHFKDLTGGGKIMQSSLSTSAIPKLTQIVERFIKRPTDEEVVEQLSKAEFGGHHDDAVQQVIAKGNALLEKDKYFEAVKFLEQATKKWPKDVNLQLIAIYSILLLMKKHGVDVGFLERAKRLLGRVESMAPNDSTFLKLTSIYEQMERDGGGSPNME